MLSKLHVATLSLVVHITSSFGTLERDEPSFRTQLTHLNLHRSSPSPLPPAFQFGFVEWIGGVGHSIVVDKVVCHLESSSTSCGLHINLGRPFFPLSLNALF